MKLEYTGPRPLDGSALPLPEGWIADEHTEPDRKVAQEKLDSGMYKRAEPEKPEKTAAKEE